MSGKDDPSRLTEFRQQEFDFTGCHSRQTRDNAFKTCRTSKRQREILSLFSIAKDGLTRQEIADRLDIPVNHITRAVLDLVIAGELLETNQTRLSRWGKSACVLVRTAPTDLPRV
jgi:hypothetical protein